MNDIQGFIANAQDNLTKLTLDPIEGYKQACAGLETLSQGVVSEGLQALQSGLQAAVNAEELTYAAIIKTTEIALVQVWAPASYMDSLHILLTFHDKKTHLLTKFARQWDEYSDSFDSAAKGEWATKARLRIKEKAQQLRGI